MYTTNSALQREVNRQRALDYCMYMMLASYFNGSICKSSFLEKRLYLYYKEQKPDNQVEMEKQCIQLIEQEILPQIPQACVDSTVRIKLTQKGDREPVLLTLYGKGYWMQVSVAHAPSGRQKPRLFLHYHPASGKYLSV